MKFYNIKYFEKKMKAKTSNIKIYGKEVIYIYLSKQVKKIFTRESLRNYFIKFIVYSFRFILYDI